MKKEERLRLAAVFEASGHRPKTVKNDLVFKNVMPEDAQKILLGMLDKGVLHEEEITGIKRRFDVVTEKYWHEVSCVWDPDKWTFADEGGPSGDWVKEHEERDRILSSTARIEYTPLRSQREVDIRYDEAKQTLYVDKRSVDQAAFVKALGYCKEEALFALADEAVVPRLREAFDRLRSVEPLREKGASLESAFRRRVTRLADQVKLELRNSGVLEFLDPGDEHHIAMHLPRYHFGFLNKQAAPL